MTVGITNDCIHYGASINDCMQYVVPVPTLTVGIINDCMHYGVSVPTVTVGIINDCIHYGVSVPTVTRTY